MIDNPKAFLSQEWINKWMGGEWRHGRISAECVVAHLEFWWHFAVVQLFSCVQLFATPWTAAHQASLSFTISWSLLKPMSIQSVMPSNYLVLCHYWVKRTLGVVEGMGAGAGQGETWPGCASLGGAQHCCLWGVNPWKPSHPWTRSVSWLDVHTFPLWPS